MLFRIPFTLFSYSFFIFHILFFPVPANILLFSDPFHYFLLPFTYSISFSTIPFSAIFLFTFSFSVPHIPYSFPLFPISFLLFPFPYFLPFFHIHCLFILFCWTFFYIASVFPISLFPSPFINLINNKFPKKDRKILNFK